jgi:hypothetical protein
MPTSHAVQTSPFLDKPSSLCQEAVAILRRLEAEGGYDVIIDAVAEATAEVALAHFMRTKQVSRRRGGHVCVNRLLGTRCPSVCFLRIPAGDHLSEWCRGKQTVAIVSQPYGLPPEALRETMAFAEQYGLDVTMSEGPGWHFPGRTLLVVFTRQGLCWGHHRMPQYRRTKRP